jgi:anti-sigma regulatory factor (Ser/Thr protein kinase)
MCWRHHDLNEKAASEMRRAIGAYLREIGESESDATAATLIVGELLSNVARYARGPICVDLDWREEVPTIVVHDSGKGFENSPQLPPEGSDHGRGLYIIAKLARRLVAEHVEFGGMRVCATLPIKRSGEIDAATCPLGTPFRDGRSCPWPTHRVA